MGRWLIDCDLREILRVICIAAVVLFTGSIASQARGACTRMMTGAEKVAWDATPWNTNPLVTNDVAYQKMAYYTFGYTFGYLGEQVAVGVLTAGTTTLARILVRTDVILIGNLAPRVVAVLAMRSHFIKEALTSLNLMDGELRLAYERMMVSAAREPTTPLIKEIPVNVMESRMANSAFNRTTFNFQAMMKAAMKTGNIRKLVKTPGREGQFMQKCAQWMELMGDKATAPAAKGWLETYERLLKFENGAFVDDRAEDFFKLLKLETAEGREAAKKSLEDYASRVATDPNAKFWIKDVEKLQAEGYRYSNFDPQFERDGITPILGPPKLKATDAPEGGWYASFDVFDSTGTAKPALQIPPANSAKYRLEFDWESVKNNVRIPRGKNHEADWFEILAKDFPLNGPGEGTQVAIDGIDVPIKAIWDISGAAPVKLY